MGWADAIWFGVYKYDADMGAGSPAGEILDRHPHSHITGRGCTLDQIWDPHLHPSGLKSVGTCMVQLPSLDGDPAVFSSSLIFLKRESYHSGVLNKICL